MKRVFYEKVGRRYQPVSEYDSDLMDSFDQGDHLVSRRRGVTSRCRVNPAFAPMIAAGLYAQDSMTRAIAQAMELKPEPVKLTPHQRVLITELTASMNQQDARWIRASAYDVAIAGVRALEEEAKALLKDEAVRHAYEQFLLVCELTKGRKNEVV